MAGYISSFQDDDDDDAAALLQNLETAKRACEAKEQKLVTQG